MIRVIIAATLATLTISTLVITTPLVTEFSNNSIDYFYSNFGEVPYGKTLSFDLIVFDQSLCGSPKDLQHLQKPTYVVVKATNFQFCQNTKRALNAQAIGAKGIIIASTSAQYAKGNVIEADDGNGKKVHITCLFITHQSFDKLRRLSKIQVTANYPVPQEKISTVSIFLSASKRSSYVFLRQFKKEWTKLKSSIILEPIYHTIACPSCNQQNCYLNQFCSFDYDHQQTGTGQKVIREQLHQAAIFSQRGPDKWFEYMNLFDEYCDGDWNNIDQCIKRVLQRMNMDDAYNVDPKTTLFTWRQRETLLGFDSFPQVAVNNMIYRGNFQVSDIVQTICSSLIDPPAYCAQDYVEPTLPTNSTNSHVVLVLLVSIGSLIVIGALGVCLYRKYITSELTKDMRSKVGQIIANYASKLNTKKKRQHEKLVETLGEEL